MLGLCCVPVEKDTAEKRAAELEAELESLRKECEERRAAEEAATQAREELVPKLLSMVDDLSGESPKSSLIAMS